MIAFSLCLSPIWKLQGLSTPEEIIDFCRSRLKSFLVPRTVVFLKSFPKNLMGKTLKKELRLI